MNNIQETKNLYLLDRNVIDLIKDLNSGKHITCNKKILMKNFLSEIDVETSSISPILSLVEGQKGRSETFLEKYSVTKKETCEINNYFKRAKTDKEYMHANILDFSKTFTESRESGWDNLEKFLVYSCKLIGGGVEKGKRQYVKEKIFACSAYNNIPKTHLAVVLSLASLYGSEAAIKVLKPSKIESVLYNVINDIYVLSRVNLIRAIALSQNMLGVNIQYITRDEGLQKVLSCIQVVSVELSENGVQQNIKYRKELFPHLTRGEYIMLLEELCS
ncbi:hypothetical protein [uncultured Deefgea sp.]|uniref:hypothetical protein n=1 Tax=uncultured Deefgea sp. TaxID=1304914 RepID=UPI00260223D3|nr:hypothetical protein [uncultured Deefgea sp.]